MNITILSLLIKFSKIHYIKKLKKTTKELYKELWRDWLVNTTSNYMCRNQLLSKILFIKIIIYEINANPITRLILCNIKYN